MDNTVHDAQRLKELRALPLERKIRITQNRIQEWYMHYDGGVYVSFSGGKDSTVLAHLTKQLFLAILVWNTRQSRNLHEMHMRFLFIPRWDLVMWSLHMVILLSLKKWQKRFTTLDESEIAAQPP